MRLLCVQPEKPLMTRPMSFTNLRMRFALFFSFFVLLSGVTNAQNIGFWDFTNVTTGVASSNNTVSVADFSPAVTNKNFNGNSEYYGQAAWPSGGLDPNYYFEFTLTPKTGYLLSILSTTLRMRRSNTGSPQGSGPTSWSIRSSLDGYTLDLASGSMTHNYANYTFLTGGGFGGLLGPVTFRVYGYNATVSSGGMSRLVFDYIQVAGLGPVLPLQLLSFQAQPSNDKVSLKYTLANTEPGSRYALQRSIDGSDFQSIQTITEVGTRDQAEYNYDDHELPRGVSKLYYRLQMTDRGGRHTFSSIAPVDIQVKSGLNATLAPQSLTIYGTIANKARISLINSSGACVLQQDMNSGGSNMTILTTPRLSPGMYYLVIATGINKQVIKLVAE